MNAETPKPYSHIHAIWSNGIEAQKAAQVMLERKAIRNAVAMSALKRAAEYLKNQNQEAAERELISVALLTSRSNINYRLISLMYPHLFSMCKKNNSLAECSEIAKLHKESGLDGIVYPEWSGMQIDAYMTAMYNKK